MESNQEEYDLVVLGSGAGGKLIAWSEAKKGKKVIVIEQKYIGGSCPNIACLPSKSIIHSSKVASFFRRSEEFGISKDGWKIDMSVVQKRKQNMVKNLIDMHLDNYKKSGAELLMGRGHFLGPKTIEVTTNGSKRIIKGKRVVINTGSRATIDPIPGMIESNPLTHIEALNLTEIPEHLVVIGGGYVGLELAQAYSRLGSQVTIIERNDRLLHREDKDISDALEELCEEEGITVLKNVKLTSIEGKSGTSVKLHGVQNQAEIAIEGSHILVAGGRTPNTDNIGLEMAGIETTSKGFVKVNERLEATAPDVWAVGDCAGSPHFTHISEDDYRILKENFENGKRSTIGRQVPFCLFTDPEFARIGLNETEAKRQGIDYQIVKIPMEAILRTRTLSETKGFVKALIDNKSDRILGLIAFGVGAGEIIAVAQIAMLGGLPFTLLRDAIFTHPTLAEGYGPLFSAGISKDHIL